MALPLVPEHEPELVRATAQKVYGGDTDKVATTSIDSLIHRGVELASRYSKAHEYRVMAAMIEDLPEELIRVIHSISCDSKIGASFEVTLLFWRTDRAREIGAALNSALLRVNKGHNGIDIKGGENTYAVAPEWGEAPF